MTAAGGAGALPGEGGASASYSAEYDGAAPRRRAARRAARTALPAATPPAAPAPARVLTPLLAPAGFRVAAPPEVLAGTALVGQAVLRQGPRHGGPPQPGWLLAGAVQPGVSPRVGGGAFAPGRRLARTRGPLCAPPSHHALVWLPFSGTTVMVRPAAGRISKWTPEMPASQATLTLA